MLLRVLRVCQSLAQNITDRVAAPQGDCIGFGSLMGLFGAGLNENGVERYLTLTNLPEQNQARQLNTTVLPENQAGCLT